MPGAAPRRAHERRRHGETRSPRRSSLACLRAPIVFLEELLAITPPSHSRLEGAFRFLPKFDRAIESFRRQRDRLLAAAATVLPTTGGEFISRIPHRAEPFLVFRP